MSLDLSSKVFLCHSPNDESFVGNLYRSLCNSCRGVNVVFPDEGSPPTANANIQINERLLEEARGSSLGVLVLTDNFFMSNPNQMLQLEALVTACVRLLPVFLTLSVAEFNNKERQDRWQKRWEEWAAADDKLVIEEWRSHLDVVRRYTGFQLGKSTLNECNSHHINMVVKEVARIIRPTASKVGEENVYGMNRLCQIVDAMYKKCTTRRSSLISPMPPQDGSTASELGFWENDGVHVYDMVGIHGFPGLGKTTLSKGLCDFFFEEFKGKVCYIDLGGLHGNKLNRVMSVLSMLDGGSTSNFQLDSSQAENLLRVRLSSMKDPIFLAIDHVSTDSESEEEAMMYLRCEIPKGSKIFITSRTERSLRNLISMLPRHCSLSAVIEYMPALNFEEARGIFECNLGVTAAAEKESFESDVKACVNMCAIFNGKRYHPLMLKSLAASLKHGNSRDLSARQAELVCHQNLHDQVPWLALFRVLELSFGQLSEKGKKVFLDLALCYSIRVNRFDMNYYEWIKMLHPETVVEEILWQLHRLCFIDMMKDEIKLHALMYDFAKHLADSGVSDGYLVLDDSRYLLEDVFLHRFVRNVSISRCGSMVFRTLDLRGFKGVKVLHLLDNAGLEEVLLSRTTTASLCSLIVSVPEGTTLRCIVTEDWSCGWSVKYLQLRGNIIFCFQPSQLSPILQAAQINSDMGSFIGKFRNLEFLGLDSLLPGSVQSIDLTRYANLKTFKLHNMLGLKSIRCSESPSTLHTVILQGVPHLEQLGLPIVSDHSKMRFFISDYDSLQRVCNVPMTAAGRLVEELFNELGILELCHNEEPSSSCASYKGGEKFKGPVLQSDVRLDAHPSSEHSAQHVTLEESTPIRVAVALKDHISRPEGIVVGVEYHQLTCHGIEFFFSTREDMAACVGVGLEQGKVVLNNDLSVAIHQLEVDEWKAEAALWGPILSDKDAHLTMAGTQAQAAEHVEEQQTLGMTGSMLARLYGVGFDGAIPYVDETREANVSSWPLLYDIALRACGGESNNDANTGKEEAGSSSHVVNGSTGTTIQNLVRRKHTQEQHGNGHMEGEDGDDGGGDENNDGSGSMVPVDDDPFSKLVVMVYPLSKREVLDWQGQMVRPGASMAPTLQFQFWRHNHRKRLFIKAKTVLQLDNSSDVQDNADRCWWYHQNISISVSCEENPVSGRVALLDSSRICNEVRRIKVSTKRNTTLSAANTFGAEGQLSVKVVEVKGSRACTSTTADSREETIEKEVDTVCKGFRFRNVSNPEFPARAELYISYPRGDALGMSAMPASSEILSEGLFSTIEPEIEGTWIPFNENDASPYALRVERSLSKRQQEDNSVLNCKQSYLLGLCVNHQMSHLKRYKGILELHEGGKIENLLECFPSC